MISHALPLWRRFLIAAMRGFYFRVRVVGEMQMVGEMPAGEGACLALISHRNGAIDGYLALAACPRLQFMLSAQLTRNRLLRLMFSGIPVVRAKDRRRYAMRRSDFADPLEACCGHLRTGGALAFFPEGSSEWGPRPQPYQAGCARIVRKMLEEGVRLRVVPIGLFYRQPDGFRSDVDVLPGPPVELPPRAPDEHPRHWERRLLAAMGAALDAVSVNCPDEETFARVERLAAAQADGRLPGREAASYARAFLSWQECARHGELPDAPAPEQSCRCVFWLYPFIAAFCLLFAPILLVGAHLGKKADGRNTVSFFRIIGGLAVALFWLPMLLALLFLFPLPMGIGLAMAWAGWAGFPGRGPS
ncbi:MAG: hypothetical protein LBI92_02480 [Azoarcus sp.]|jgi:1-acyl-sn-glycerol-3-phosphate acyltransferase|nr:hypothetical protein [Azoarcus sp.]